MNNLVNEHKQNFQLKVLPELSIDVIQANLDKYTFFSAVRYLEVLFNNSEGYRQIGESFSPTQDYIYIRQNPSLAFNFKNLDSIELKNNKIQLSINEVGLLSLNTPLPSHLIEYIYQRKHQYGDNTWTDFINMLQQRILTIFYRSWMNAQSVLSIENKNNDKFSRYIASMIGLAGLDKNNKDNYVDYYSKLYFSGFYLQRNKSKINLESLLSQYFVIPIRIKENFGRWFKLPADEQTKLEGCKYNLGDGLVIGNKVYDTQTKIRIVIGPVNLEICDSFLKNGFNAKRLIELIELYLGTEYDWDVQIILAKESVPLTKLGKGCRLGYTAYIGKVDRDVGDIIVKY